MTAGTWDGAPWDGGPGPASVGLVALEDLTAATAALGLTADQTALLPDLIDRASRLIRKHCNRYFNRRPSADGSLGYHDGLYTLDWPSRSFLLRQFPVNRIRRVRTSPTEVLTIVNTDTTTNQQATAELLSSGVADVDDVPPVVTSLYLWRVASGVESENTLALASYPTLAGLAAAVNALSGGWTATVASGHELWPTADLRAGQGAQPALGQDADAGFVVHVRDVPVRFDPHTGIVTLQPGSNDPFTSPRFGAYLQTDTDDLQVSGGLQGVRVIYDAGWDTVPGDVQQATIETVIDMLSLLEIDQRLQSESNGSYSYVLNKAFPMYAVPQSVLGKLDYYRSHRA